MNYYYGNNAGYYNSYNANPNPYMSINQQPQIVATLNGKMVDGEEMVRATEVPIGGFGVFPKADLSEIYIKSWNPNGTTSVLSYRPVLQQQQTQQAQIEDNSTQQILERISALENKIDAALAQSSNQTSQVGVKAQPVNRAETTAAKKEIIRNEY